MNYNVKWCSQFTVTSRRSDWVSVNRISGSAFLSFLLPGIMSYLFAFRSVHSKSASWKPAGSTHRKVEIPDQIQQETCMAGRNKRKRTFINVSDKRCLGKKALIREYILSVPNQTNYDRVLQKGMNHNAASDTRGKNIRISICLWLAKKNDKKLKHLPGKKNRNVLNLL